MSAGKDAYERARLLEKENAELRATMQNERMRREQQAEEAMSLAANAIKDWFSGTASIAVSQGASPSSWHIRFVPPGSSE